jgi:hypothetical protein
MSVIKSDIILDGTTIHHKRTQPTEQMILERNQNLRNSPGTLKDLSFGRQLASIPFNMWEAAVRAGYDLNNPDSDISGKEMMRYLKSEEGRKCIVQPKEKV